MKLDCTYEQQLWSVKISCLLILLIASSYTFGQRERAYNWAMPTNCGIDFSGPTPVNFTANIAGAVLSQGSSTISDENGNLLFYSNGEKAWNYLHQEMLGGGNLMGNREATQSSLIIPDILNSNRYFLFTMDDNGVGDGLNYYVVDMSLNNGEGMVLNATQLATNVTEKLCATKHANDIDFWVLTHKWQSDTFLAFHVDSFGVDPIPVVSTVGESHTGNTNSAMGQMKVSPDGTKIAIASLAGGHIELLSFNNETGEVTKPLLIESFVSHFPFGVEFSPDSRKLYYTQRFSAVPEAILYQYDIDHIDTNCLLDSKFELAQIDELKVPSNLQLATNGKIYMTVNYFPTYDTLAVINNPNEYGNAANFDEFGYVTNSSVREGLPNFVSTYVSDGIHLEFGTTCDGAETVMWPADSLTPDSVRWNFGDPSSGSNSSTDMQTGHIFSSPDTFNVTLYAHSGNNTDTFYRNVIIWDTATDILGNDTTICNGSGSINLDASWYNACHKWSTGSTASSINISTGGIYWVDVFYQSCTFRDTIDVADVNGPPLFDLGPDTAVCGTFSFVLDPDLPNAFYTWGDGSHDTVFTVTSTGTYALTATNACGNTSDEINVSINTLAQPVVDFPVDTTICDTGSLNFDFTFEAAEYLWNDGLTSPIRSINSSGVYWLRIANVCDTVSDTIAVSVESELESALDTALILCDESESLTLRATKDSVIANWNDGTVSPTFVASEDGIISFTASNTCGNITDSVRIIAWDTNFKLFVGRDTLLCSPNGQVQLSDTGSDYLFSYLWNNDSTGSSLTVSEGLFSVTATNRCASVSDTVEISQVEPIEILAPDTNVCEGQSIRIALNSAGVRSASWSNGEENFDAVITEPGLISVVIVDTNSCVYKDSIMITDDCPTLVYIPNVFTPDGDGINDEYCVELKNVIEYSIAIYNRWGNHIFQSTESPCWDGQISGSPAAYGVYYYLINASDQDGNETNFRGSLNLFR